VKYTFAEWVMSHGLKWHPELNIKGFHGTDYSAMAATIPQKSWKV